MIDDMPRVFSRVRAALRKLGRTNHETDDLLHDAFVKLSLYEKENVVDKPEAFLMTTAINLAKDAHRAQGRRGEQVLLEDQVIMDTAPSIEDIALSRERMVRLAACLDRLPEKTRDIFMAHRVEGVRYEDIARRHGLSVSSVEKQVAKALLLLANDMEGWYP